MILTIDFIKENFIVFNSRYFNGKLRMPSFIIKTRKSRLGECSWKMVSGVRTNYTIMLSDYFKFGEKKYQNVLLHEMIHLYIRQNNLKDTRRHHGELFYSIADRINKDGWNIARTDSVLGYDTKEKKTYHMVAFEDSENKYFLMAYSPYREKYYLSYFAKYPNHFKNAVWFTSDDSKAYGRFTTCYRSVRGYFINQEEFKALQTKYAMLIAI